MSALQTIWTWFLHGLGFAAGWTILKWLAALASSFFARIAAG